MLFEQTNIDAVMRHIRDDLTVLARGCAWLRYEAKGDNGALTERVCIEYVDRKDFLHDPARTWEEVDWVAKASYLDKEAMRKRFPNADTDDAAYSVRKKEKGEYSDDSKLKAKVWEIWCRSLNRVVWVTEGVEQVLDEGEPHLKLEGFFPCPKPAYGTLQRRTLIPVPDMVFYKDQLEEINEITARLSSLSEVLKVRGFYPAGVGEIGDAIEAAMKSQSNNAVLIPISNWSMLGGSAAKDAIVWLPLEMVATTITGLVELRKQLIEDVYQITGISDIMRGSTEASETLGAQQLKSQYGSIRIRDRQYEMVRLALDVTRIAAEIMAENFQGKTLLDMTQIQIPTEKEVADHARQLEVQAQQIMAQVQQAQQNPQIVAQAQQNPEQAQQLLGQAQQQVEAVRAQIAQIKEAPTLEKVIAFLRDQKMRPFVLDIETDSTIAPDENAQKQRATEFITAVGGYMRNAVPLVQQLPQAAKMAGEMLKYIVSQFRAGRELETTIDEFADQIGNMAGQSQGPSPEQMQAEAEAQATQQKLQLEIQTVQQKAQLDAAKHQFEQEKAANSAQLEQGRLELERWKAELTALTAIETAKISAKASVDSDAVAAQLEKLLGFAQMAHEQGMQAREQVHEANMAQQDQAHQADMAAQGQAHDAQQADADRQAAAEAEPA